MSNHRSCDVGGHDCGVDGANVKKYLAPTQLVPSTDGTSNTVYDRRIWLG